MRSYPTDDERRWADDARCRGKLDLIGSLFFAPERERPEARIRREARAAEFCAPCPVRGECRSHANEFGEYGWWGGSEEERDERRRVNDVRRGRRARSRYDIALPEQSCQAT